MYEVFLNERRLILAADDDLPNLDEKVRMARVATRGELAGEVDRFLISREPAVMFTGDLPALWGWFRLIFREIPAAGGIVRSPRGVLFIFRRGKWDLPKGKIDKDETPREAALREVTEETGLTRITITGQALSTWHLYLSDYPGKPREWILKETRWFFMESAGEEIPIPESAEDIEEVRWVNTAQIPEILEHTYASLRKVIVMA